MIKTIHHLIFFLLIYLLPPQKAAAMLLTTIPTIRIHTLSQLQRVRGGQISVGRGDRQDQASLLADKLHQHVPDLGLNVDWLVAHGNLGETGQIN